MQTLQFLAWSGLVRWPADAFETKIERPLIHKPPIIPAMTTPVTADSRVKNGIVMHVGCLNCDNHAPADLAAIIRRGSGRRPLIELRFRCGKWGKYS